MVGQEAPDARDIYVESIDYSGNGCPSGSVAINISDDGKAFTVLYDSFYVDFENARNPTRIVVTCNLGISLHVPQGWSYGLFSLDTRGYASLDRGVNGWQSATYRFPSQTGVKPINLGAWLGRGPFDDDYHAYKSIPLSSVKWSPCDGRSKLLAVKTDITLSKGYRSPRADGIVTVDSQDGELRDQYGLTWRKCTSGENDGNAESSLADISRLAHEAQAVADVAVQAAMRVKKTNKKVAAIQTHASRIYNTVKNNIIPSLAGTPNIGTLKNQINSLDTNIKRMVTIDRLSNRDIELKQAVAQLNRIVSDMARKSTQL